MTQPAKPLPMVRIPEIDAHPSLSVPEWFSGGYKYVRMMTMDDLLAIVRTLGEEERHEVAKACGVKCWPPWHRHPK
jgi:hypothetical protein